MEVIGVTTDKKNVVKGLFSFYSTSGLPLVDIWRLCHINNLCPSWIDFYEEAVNNKWKYKTIINRLKDSLDEVYGVEYRKIVIERLYLIFKKNKTNE